LSLFLFYCVLSACLYHSLLLSNFDWVWLSIHISKCSLNLCHLEYICEFKYYNREVVTFKDKARDLHIILWTRRSRVFLEKLRFIQLVIKLRAVCWTRGVITVFRRAHKLYKVRICAIIRVTPIPIILLIYIFCFIHII
jgi:hypothetical protein